MLETPVNVYLKRHSKTGKLYFGKTIVTDLEKYKGSGKLWSRHCNKHGWNFVENIFVYTFIDKRELVDFCLSFSEIYDIVDSDKFSNLVEETGLDGGNRTHVNFINKSGELFYLHKSTYKTNNVDDEYVKLQSNEGRRRFGTSKIHKNYGTVSIYDKETLTVYRELKTTIANNPSRYINVSSHEYRKLANLPTIKSFGGKNVQIVLPDGTRTSITREEYNTGNYLSSNTKLAKEILNISADGNRKNTVTCRDIFGKIVTVSKIEYWNQLEIYGEDRTNWPYVHPAHPVGKQRKLLT